MSQTIKYVFIILAIICFQLNAGSDFFASQVGFDSLLITEKLLLSNLEKYVEAAQEKLTEIDGIIENISKEHPGNVDNLENYLSNPIRAFSLLKRLVITWPEIKENLEDNTARDNFVYIKSLHQSFDLKYPDQQDFKGASLALARIQDTYDLNIRNLTEGIVNKKYSQRLSWIDCFYIGNFLYFSNLYKLALVWIKESERKLLLSDDNNNSTLANLYENIAANSIKLGLLSESVEAIEKISELNPDSSGVASRQEELMNGLGEGVLRTYKDSTEYDLYKKVCRDEIVPSPSQQRNLRCRYKIGPEPYLKLAAFKMEELSLDPYAVLYYNAISNKEIDLIKSNAQANIHISTVVGYQGLVDHRISKQAWLPYKDYDFLKPISQRITDLTGLSMMDAEHFQVVNYGMGGHYEPHTDSFEKMEKAQKLDHGNRIATALFYLSNVDFGGSTAFPYLSVNVKAEKGKLLYWENIHAGGDVDFRTKHAGCPVVLGNKWIANAWLRSGDQAFRRPCGLKNDNAVSVDFKQITYLNK
ncbi:hypothetical protein ACFFRR_005725 [Megaselia abdita]